MTALAKGERTAEEPGEAATDPSAASYLRGYSWGSAVHGALALAASEPSTELLRVACRDLLIEHERPLDDRGEPVELTELLDLVAAVRRSELWRRAKTADRMLVEIPFAVRDVEIPTRPRTGPEAPTDPDSGRPQLDLFGGGAAPGIGGGHGGETAGIRAESGDGGGVDSDRSGIGDVDAPSVLEGVIDLVFRERGGWVIADYKTDVGTDPDFAARMVGYRRQVDLYASAWSRLTGEPVKERILFFTAQGRTESW